MARRDRGKPRQGIVKEAWDNMRRDLSRFLPAAAVEKLGKGRRSWQLMLLIAVLELIVLGILGKLAYDWLAG
ncbi:MAG TPA: hypothetical protein VJ910_13445 [Desulfuromonadales bacterium]|nr:hypothetical protein [Desulfuromonadales bacterium]